MKWYENSWSLLEKKKREMGEIPTETCPDIDKIIAMLESLRADNAKLRELGREWYEFAEEVASAHESMRDEYDKMEEERDSLYKEVNDHKCD